MARRSAGDAIDRFSRGLKRANACRLAIPSRWEAAPAVFWSLIWSLIYVSKKNGPMANVPLAPRQFRPKFFRICVVCRNCELRRFNLWRPNPMRRINVWDYRHINYFGRRSVFERQRCERPPPSASSSSSFGSGRRSWSCSGCGTAGPSTCNRRSSRLVATAA